VVHCIFIGSIVYAYMAPALLGLPCCLGWYFLLNAELEAEIIQYFSNG
jgi:hypothetical protein